MPSFVVTVAMVSSFSDRMCSSQERVRERPTTHADYTRHARRETLRPGYNSAYESGATLRVQNRNFRANWITRGSSRVLRIWPKVRSLKLPSGLANCVWFQALENSERNSDNHRSPIS